jgi:hypothetical protein
LQGKALFFAEGFSVNFGPSPNSKEHQLAAAGARAAASDTGCCLNRGDPPWTESTTPAWDTYAAFNREPLTGGPKRNIDPLKHQVRVQPRPLLRVVPVDRAVVLARRPSARVSESIRALPAAGTSLD